VQGADAAYNAVVRGASHLNFLGVETSWMSEDELRAILRDPRILAKVLSSMAGIMEAFGDDFYPTALQVLQLPGCAGARCSGSGEPS
jgi:hypothetical protein